MPSFRRTHTCGELREGNAGQTVTLNGWVHTARDHGQFVFVHLRDRYGMTQVVFEKDRDNKLFAESQELRAEFCIMVRGVVAKRLPGKERADQSTGMIEVQANELKVLNKCPPLPFDVAELPGT